MSTNRTGGSGMRSPAASEARTSSQEARAIMRNIYACYFLSGALGLMYQILWLRKLLLIFGSTVHAVSTVLTVFFGGLALGSWFFGRLIDRREGAGLRWYALLEFGVGVYAFATPLLFDAMRRVYLPMYQASNFSPTVLVGASFICSAAILLIPTILLGGTFPVLSRFLIRSAQGRGAAIAGLYGVNTAGAMAGTLFVYYVGLPTLGLLRTLWCAGVMNIGIGGLCLIFDRHLAELGLRPATVAEGSPPALAREEPIGAIRWLFLAFGLSGFSAMVYEVAWTRALSLVLGSSIYAFCIMLATFLCGMAIGSLWARQALLRAPAKISWFIRIELLLGAYGLCSIPLLSQLPEWFVTLWPLTRQSFSGLLWLQAILSACAMILPTVAMGVLFPVVSDLVTGRFAQLGQRLGTAYAINTLGGIVGSFLSGFVLIPFFGLPWAIVTAALINLGAGALVYVRFGRWGSWVPRLATTAVVLVLAGMLSHAVIIPSWQRQAFAAGVYISPETYQTTSIREAINAGKLLYYRDSLNATVSVHQQGKTLSLKVGGKTDASNGVDMGTQVLSAHIPMLLHPGNPKRVLVIGLGSGVTLGEAGRYPVSTLHCAEIDPAVVEAARYFKAYNDGIHDDPRARIFPADGRNFLLASREHYDVIISEPSNPWMAGLAYLFTQEFYQLAKQRLAPGGVMCQWLQLYRIFPSDVKLMLKTFHHEFPYVSVWSTIPGDLLLVGSMEPLQFDYQRLAERMASPNIKQGLAAIQIDRPEVLLSLFQFGNRAVEELTADVSWLHQDDQPWLEFNAPKALYADSMFLENYLGLERFAGPPEGGVQGYESGKEDAAFYSALASMYQFRNERDKVKKALEQVIARDAATSDTWMRLGKLYAKDGEFFKADEALAKASQLAPTQVEPYRLEARLYWQQRRFHEARSWYEQASRVRPPDDMLAEEIGNYLREQREFLLAAEHYRSAISQGGGSRSSLVLAYANTLKELRSWSDAEHALRFGLKAFPQEAAMPLLLGQTLLDQEKWLDALPIFDRALTMTPESAEACYGLARILVSQGQKAQAVRYLKRSLQYSPYYREALGLLFAQTHEDADVR